MYRNVIHVLYISTSKKIVISSIVSYKILVNIVIRIVNTTSKRSVSVTGVALYLLDNKHSVLVINSTNCYLINMKTDLLNILTLPILGTAVLDLQAIRIGRAIDTIIRWDRLIHIIPSNIRTYFKANSPNVKSYFDINSAKPSIKSTKTTRISMTVPNAHKKTVYKANRSKIWEFIPQLEAAVRSPVEPEYRWPQELNSWSHSNNTLWAPRKLGTAILSKPRRNSIKGINDCCMDGYACPNNSWIDYKNRIQYYQELGLDSINIRKYYNKYVFRLLLDKSMKKDKTLLPIINALKWKRNHATKYSYTSIWNGYNIDLLPLMQYYDYHILTLEMQDYYYNYSIGKNSMYDSLEWYSFLNSVSGTANLSTNWTYYYSKSYFSDGITSKNHVITHSKPISWTSRINVLP